MTETERQALRGAIEAMQYYVLKCDFHTTFSGSRVLSKPMPTDSDINRMKQAITEAEAVLKGEKHYG
jgi:hypothetical protein